METAKTLTEAEMIIRLSLGFLAGGIIGFERSSRRQVAGLRTHILIALGATSLMLLSIWLPQTFSPLRLGDPGRIAAQVFSGMGFLGVGAIIRLGNNVKDLTTAASLWVTAAIGMLMGAGMFVLASSAVILSLVTLTFLGKVDKKIFPETRNKFPEIHYKDSNSPDTKIALDVLKKFGIKKLSVNVKQNLRKGKNSGVRFLVNMPDIVDISRLARELKSSCDIVRVEIKENF